MKRNFWLIQLPFVILIMWLAIIAASWQGRPAKTRHTNTDTIPNKKIKNIDDAIEQLKKSRQDLERTLKDKDLEKEMKEALDKVEFDADKIKTEITDAIKDVDVKRIQADIDKALKEVDFSRIQTELKQKLDKADFGQLKDEIEKALKDIDMEKLKLDVTSSISKIDMDEIKIELDKVKEIDFKKIEEDLKKIKPDIEKAMEDAKESIERAKNELLEYKSFIDGLDKDGLIEKDNDYTIKYKNGELTINDKKQPADVVKKYSSFLNDHKNFTIKKNKDAFDIDNN